MSEHVMYIAAKKLPPGKLAAQVGHAVLGCYRLADDEKIKLWLYKDDRGDGGTQAKVVLRIEGDSDVDAIVAYCRAAKIPYYVVIDAGRTVVEPGTMTAIAWGPVPKDEDGPWKVMKLY